MHGKRSKGPSINKIVSVAIGSIVNEVFDGLIHNDEIVNTDTWLDNFILTIDDVCKSLFEKSC